MIAKNTFFVSSLLLLLATHPPLLSSSPKDDTTDVDAQLDDEDAKIKALLKKVNRPYVKTFETPEGEIVDCVPFHLQLAFDNRNIPVPETLEPPKFHRIDKSDNTIDYGDIEIFTQQWTKIGETCPKGTVPITRTMEENVRRVGADCYGKKIMPWTQCTKRYVSYQHSTAEVMGSLYFGAQATFNIWKPQVANSDEFSSSRLQILLEAFDSDFKIIKVGWQVYPHLYGDASPRLFVYWMLDPDKKEGCYDLRCPGFIQVSNQIVVGAAFTETSTYNGNQYATKLTVWVDQATGNWWLRVGTITVGYWPKSLFTNIGNSARLVDYGGVIVNKYPFGLHTMTQMGSGHFAEEGFGKVAYVRNLALVNERNMLYPVKNHTFRPYEPYYNIQGSEGSNWGIYFFFGGPGKNPRYK